MRDKHIFSKSYTKRKEALLYALHRENAVETERKARGISCIPVRIMASAVILSVLSISAFAAARWVDFRMEKNGDEVRIHASLNKDGVNSDSGNKPLRSWRAEDGEISVSLQIPDLPADMSEDQTANGKYGSENISRAMTINGIDLRRSDLNQLINGATDAKQFALNGKTMYVVEKGEADYYNRIAYILFEQEELVLKLWVSYGITEAELTTLASTITVTYTTDALHAIPILNEMNSVATDVVPDVLYAPDSQISEVDLVEIGQSARAENDWYTITVNRIETFDSISALDPESILDKDFVGRFIDHSGKLIPYIRTEVVWKTQEGKQATKHFGESVSVTKKLYVVTLTMEDVTVECDTEEDRETMRKALVNGFKLNGYTIENGNLVFVSHSAVVNRQPGERACSSELVYREYLGGNQWRIAYLIDEDTASSGIVLHDDVGGIAVKIQ